MWRGAGGEVFLALKSTYKPHPIILLHRRRTLKKESIISPLMWRGVGGEVFLALKSTI
jgi:hypothetical protein